MGGVPSWWWGKPERRRRRGELGRHKSEYNRRGRLWLPCVLETRGRVEGEGGRVAVWEQAVGEGESRLQRKGKVRTSAAILINLVISFFPLPSSSSPSTREEREGGREGGREGRGEGGREGWREGRGERGGREGGREEGREEGGRGEGRREQALLPSLSFLRSRAV